MLSKKERLPIGTASLKMKTSVRAPGLTIKVATSNLPFGRFGIIIPKAVAPAATSRNRLKRAAFEVFKTHAEKLAGKDVLCVLSKGAPLLKDVMMKELNALLSQLT